MQILYLITLIALLEEGALVELFRENLSEVNQDRFARTLMPAKSSGHNTLDRKMTASDQKTWKVTHLDHTSGQARHLLVSKVTHQVSVALGLYESHLVSQDKSHNSRRNALMACSYLYSWAGEVGIDVDRRFLSGVGLDVREIRRFAHWLKYTYTGRQGEPLSSGAIGSIFTFCLKVSEYMYEQYFEVTPPGADREGALLIVLANNKANWSSLASSHRDTLEALDLTDDELARIEAAIRPEERTDVPLQVATRDYLLWRLTSRLGLRIGEVLALRLVDCPNSLRDPLRIVRIADRGKTYRDPRTPYAPRPKTEGRELNLSEDPLLPDLLNHYLSSRRALGEASSSGTAGDHDFLIVNHLTGQPLSTSRAQQIAERISELSHVKFHWHLARHAYFNREFAKIAGSPNYGALRDVLQYKGGWSNPMSLNIYTKRILRERALGALGAYHARLDKMGLEGDE